MATDTLPPLLPKIIYAPGGPIQVTLVAEVVSERFPGLTAESEKAGNTTMGMWFPVERRIRLRRDMPLDVLWPTLFHEQMHAWLVDTGAVHGFTELQMEQICDVVGLGRLVELRARKLGRGG